MNYLNIIEVIMIFILLFIPGFRNLLISKENQQPSNLKPERSGALDAIRGISMIGIVLIHVHSYISYYHPEDSILNFTRSIANLSRFSVPIFIITSGIHLSFKGYREYVNARLYHLILPYTIFCFIGYPTKYSLSLDSLHDFGFRYITGTIFEPYYYIPLILQFYILFFLFEKFFSQSAIRLWLLLGISFGINFLSNLFFPKGNFLELSTFTNFIFFFSLGYSGRNLLRNPKYFLNYFETNQLKWLLLFILALCIGTILFFTLSAGFALSNHSLLYPTICFFLMYYLSIQREIKGKKAIFSILEYIGKNSLFIFLGHPIFIHIQHSWDPYAFGGRELSWLVILFLNLGVPLSIGELYKLVFKGK